MDIGLDNGGAALGHLTNASAWRKSASSYDGLYGGLPLHVVDRVTSALERVIEHKSGNTHDCKEITLLDYGCGTARYLPLLQKLAAEKSVHIRYLALDIAPEMLEATEKRAQDEGYEPLRMRGTFPLNDPLHVEHSQGHRGPAYKKNFGEGSVTVQLLQPNILRESGDKGPIATPEFLEQALLNEHIDMSLCMFGVVNYNPQQSVRRMILSILNNVTDGPILVSSPTPMRDPIAFAEHNQWREELENPAISEARRVTLEKRLGDAKEHGNTYIWFPGKKDEATGKHDWEENLYHFYDTPQFLADMQAAGLQATQIGCVNRKPEAEITHSLQENLQDYRDSVSLKPEEYDTKGMFLFCDALSSRAAAAGMPPAASFYPPSQALMTRLTDEIRKATPGTERQA